MTFKSWAILIFTFVFFTLSPITLVVLHKIMEVILLTDIRYDSVIGTSAVFLYLILAIVLIIYLLLTYYVDTHKNNKTFVKRMLLATVFGVTLGVINYANIGLSI